MQINRELVLVFLKIKQDENGGYTGQDIAELAKKLSVSEWGLKKRIDYWTQTDQNFAKLKYLGKRSISMTLDDFFIINQSLKSNPLILKTDILEEVNKLRYYQGLLPIPEATFYRITEQHEKQLFSDVPDEIKWLYANKIGISSEYTLLLAHQSLTNVFTFSELKTFWGVDIEGINDRLDKAEKWFYKMYMDIEPLEWYFRIRNRIKVFQAHLRYIKSDKSLPSQARLIFESQVAFLVDCKDLFIEEIIHKGGRIQQKMNESRKDVENDLLKKWKEQYTVIGWNVVNNPNGDNLNKLKEMLETKKLILNDVELLLLKTNMKDLDFIYDCLDKYTNHFSENKINLHDSVAGLILDICRGTRQSQFLSYDECLKITRNKVLIQELQLPDSSFKKALLAKKLLHYIQNGKFTISDSFKFQDLGEHIKNVILTDKDEFITKEDGNADKW